MNNHSQTAFAANLNTSRKALNEIACALNHALELARGTVVPAEECHEDVQNLIALLIEGVKSRPLDVLEFLHDTETLLDGREWPGDDGAPELRTIYRNAAGIQGIAQVLIDRGCAGREEIAPLQLEQLLSGIEQMAVAIQLATIAVGCDIGGMTDADVTGYGLSDTHTSVDELLAMVPPRDELNREARQ